MEITDIFRVFDGHNFADFTGVNDILQFLEETGYTFPVYFDTHQSAAIAYGVTSIPATYFINEKGEVVTYGLGALSGDIIQWGIDMLLGTEK